MVRSAFCDCLMDVYLGEQAGEAAFEAMLPQAENLEQKYILGTLLQAETEGKALMRPLLAQLGLDISGQLADLAGGVEVTNALGKLPWQERFASMGEFARTSFLPRYEQLAELGKTEEDAEASRIASFMAQHERALIALCENVSAGYEDPAAPLAALLHFPLPKPNEA